MQTKNRATHLHTSSPSSSREGLFFGGKWAYSAMLIVGLSGGCGGGGGSSGESSNQNTPPPPSSPPITSVPTNANALIELGPISGGSIRFQSLSGTILGTGGSASDGSLIYSPRDIISKIGNDPGVIAFVYGGQDTDADDDGITDLNATPINGSFFVYISREQMEKGGRIVIGPRAGVITESILGRLNAVFSKEILDNIARETGATDVNGDGVITYDTDILEVQMKNIDDVSGMVPAVSGYIRSVHTGDALQKQTALSNIAKTENHILASIVADTGGSHLPSLKLKSISGADILYTSDLSSPLPNSGSTKIVSGEVVLPFGGGKIYYRERYTLGGKVILGKVRGFDLTTDWTELSQTGIPYNASGSDKQTLERGVYKDINYTIFTSTNKISSGYTYPKFIGCTVGGPGNAGCDFGPYIAWSPEHENVLRQIVLTAIKNYIDTPSSTVPPTPPTPVPPSPPETPPSPILPLHPQNQLISTTGKVENYYGGWYEVYNQWNLSGTSDFPVKIIGNYSTQSGGRQPNLEQMAYTEAERQSKTNWMVSDVQTKLSDDYNKLPPPTYPPNYEMHSGWISYRGYGYDIVTTMNIRGNSDYPANIYASYTTPTGSAKTVLYQVNSAGDLLSVQSVVINEAKAHIDLVVDKDVYPPNYVEMITPTTAYGGGSYSTTFTYSGNPDQDYPGYIDVQSRFRNGSTDVWTFQASDSSQRAAWIAQGEAKAREDIDNYNPTYSKMELKSEGPYSYGSRGSIYTIYARYNNNHENKNYPAKIWIEYKSGAKGSLQNTWNTYGQTWANTSIEKEQIKATLEQWVQGQMVASGSFQKEKETPFEFPNFGLISSAYALPSTSASSIIVKQNPASLNNILSGNTWQSSFFAKGATETIYTQRQEKKPSLSGKNPDELSLNIAISQIKNNAEKIELIYRQCSGAGTTMPVGNNDGCVLTPAQKIKIQTYENSIFITIGNYLQFGGGLSVGSGKAIYEEIMGIGSDVVELADGTTLQAFEKNLSSLKAKVGGYVVNGKIDYTKIKNDFITVSSAIEQEISLLIGGLPGALARLDSYNQGYYTGSIGAGMILELANPTKKLKLITKGFSVGKWATTARYIIDASKAGHSGTKMVEIAEKLRSVQWSRVDKPDMSKITNPDLISQINKNYRDGAIIGNQSTADAIRYTKTTEILVGGSDHLQKGQDTMNALDKRFRANDLNPIELSIAKAIYNDIQSALGGN